VPGSAATTPPPASTAPPRTFSIAPRTAAPFQTKVVPLPNGEQAWVVTGGVILLVRDVERVGLIDVEADRLVLWSKHGLTQQLTNGLSRPEGHTGRDLEFYLAGHVILREQEDPRPQTPPPGTQPPKPGPKPAGEGGTQVPDDNSADTTSVNPPAAGSRADQPVAPPKDPGKGPVTRTLMADEVYYDVSRNVAVALNADVEIKQPGLPDPLHFKGIEVQQLAPGQFKGFKAQVFASKLPSDPGLDVTFDEATLDQHQVVKRGLLGQVINRKTGQPVMEERDDIVAEDNVFHIEHIPVFFLPSAKFDAHDPLGPVNNFSIGYNQIFGFQASVTLNVYDLLGIDPEPGSRWNLDTDYLSLRGPALGTRYDSTSSDWFGIPAKNSLLIRAWGIDDNGTDVLGGGRGEFDHHPELRGRFLYRQNVQDLPDGFSFQAQGSALSDKNFLEQYYKLEFDIEPNQETFLYVKQQQDNWAWTILTEPNIRRWVNETEWLPRADAFLLGQPVPLPLLDRLVYSGWASAGYAHLLPTQVPPPPEDLTTRDVATGRFDITQELSLPFYAGPFKVVPYGVLDLTYYTEDLKGTDVGRVYGGGGVRASIPFTRLYPDIQSDWLNLNGINHKIVLSGNYYAAQASTPFTNLPQLDRLNDDASDQALRDIKPLEPIFNPANGLALATSPVYDPQLYAIRRLVENRIDTRDDIEELDVDLRQRWQTKRGYPGLQHIVDWMTLDVSATVFPHSQRDDFGHTLGFIDYDWLWNVGDRNGFASSGTFEPFPGGARVWNFGAFYDRIDRTNLYLGYRQIDPLDSRLVIGSVSYVLSPKYALTASAAYDFGTNQSQSNTLILTRIGSDLQVSLGVTYNSITNNFGFLFEIVPNAVAQTRRAGALQAVNPAGAGLLGGH
jgi:hypothetical protein